MAPSSDDKGKRPMEEDHQDRKLKEEQVAGSKLPVLDLNFMLVIKEGLLVTNELCAQYRVLKREIQILQEENLRLRRMLELLIGPRMILPPPPKE
jgi:hypothetical protein